MIRRCLLALVLVAVTAADATAEPDRPEWPLHLIRLPLRSAVIERGCGFGVLTFATHAELTDRRQWVGMLAGFGRCRLPGRLQVRLNVPVVLGGFYSQFEGVRETGPGNPVFELKWQALAWHRFHLAPYAAIGLNLQEERAGQVEPGLAVSAVVRGVSLHGNVEAVVPFGVGNGRRTYNIGLAASYPLPLRYPITAYIGGQDAIDPLEDSFWADARALTLGASYALSDHWLIEGGVRIGTRPEAELVYNSLGEAGGFLNLVNRPAD